VADIEDAQDRLAETEARIDEVGAEFEEVKTQLRRYRERLETTKSEKNDRQREQDRLLDEARRRSNERRETEAAIEEANEEIPALETAIEDLETERQKAAQNHATAAEAVDELRAERTELRDTLDGIEDELTAAQQEYAELEAKASQTGDSSYGRAVTTVLNAGFDGVHGTVAKLGRVEEQYATACETAAGGRMANVVVDTDRVGQECIEHLKSRNAGRATFLPLTEMEDRGLARKPDRPGVIGFAAELVSFDAEYAGVFSYVLGSTLVVETIETARALMGKYRLVTLDGELVERSGAMTGGSNSGSRYSFAGSSGKLERVAERIERLESERRSLREELRETERQLESARDRASTAADQVREIDATIESREAELAATRDQIDELKTTLADIEAEREQVSDQMDAIEADIATTNETIATIEAEIDELEAEIKDSALPSLTAQAESIREEIDDLETHRDELETDLNELELKKQYANESINDLQAEIDAADEQIETATNAVATLETERNNKQAQLEEKIEAVAALEDELAKLKAERDALQERVDDARADRNAAQEQVAVTEDELAAQQEKRERLEWEIDELAAEVGAYDPAAVPDRETVTAELDRLEGEMAALEPVNMLAIEEYDEVQKTLEQLRERKQTLVGEADAIHDRIADYEARKKETFMESFQAIDTQFQRIFERLSNGTGRLHLESEDDPFDGGLTMKAQPGNKPIQRLDAMSGGEKSLTALALIFAIQRHNPAPFYALDEVDAFLDAANADLVGELVDELAGEAQFIVVSHRSKMLERSERAIGITMQENNISTVTGIDLSGPDEAPADD
jgi:condensin subunit Smc